MTEFEKQLQADRRLCILRLLKEAGGSANDSILRAGLESLGHVKLSREKVREDLRFLIGAGLLCDEFLGEIQVVNITKRGVEVAEGRLVVSGIKRPSIGI